MYYIVISITLKNIVGPAIEWIQIPPKLGAVLFLSITEIRSRLTIFSLFIYNLLFKKIDCR